MTGNDGKILSLFSIILQKNSHGNQDLLNLYSDIGDFDIFLKVISRFSGRSVKFPTGKEIEDALSLALAYYYHEEEGRSWEEIRKLIPYDTSPLSYNARFNSLNDYIKKKIAEVIHKK